MRCELKLTLGEWLYQASCFGLYIQMPMCMRASAQWRSPGNTEGTPMKQDISRSLPRGSRLGRHTVEDARTRLDAPWTGKKWQIGLPRRHLVHHGARVARERSTRDSSLLSAPTRALSALTPEHTSQGYTTAPLPPSPRSSAPVRSRTWLPIVVARAWGVWASASAAAQQVGVRHSVILRKAIYYAHADWPAPIPYPALPGTPLDGRIVNI